MVDVLFGMMFIGIVVALSMTAYSLIMKNTFSMQNSKYRISNEIRLQSTLDKDLWQADSVQTNETGIVIYKDTVEISYNILDEYWVRKQYEVIDTFSGRVKFSEFNEGALEISYSLFGETYTNTYFDSRSRKDDVNQQTLKLVNRY